MSEMRENRRSEILRAACMEFSEKGFSSTRMEEIAKRVGIGKSTLYEYFASKTELLQAACEWIFDNIIDEVQKIMQSDLSFCERVRNYLEYVCKVLNSLGNGMTILYGTGNSIEVVRGHAKIFHSKILNIVETAAQQAKEKGELREDISSASIARMITFMPSPILCKEIASGDKKSLNDAIIILTNGFSKKM